MRLASPLCVLFLVLSAATARAQTTGQPGLNDYTINGQGSGGTSPRSLVLPVGRSGFTVSTSAPGQLVVFAFSSNLPCTPGAACFAPSPCPLPATACGGSTNQSLDILFGSTVFVVQVSVASGGGGVSRFSAHLPPNIDFSTQVGIIDSTCGTTFFGLGSVLLSQAYDART